MKLSKSSSSTLSYIMGISVAVITAFAFLSIAIAMKNVYLKAMNDMTNVAVHNIDEHVRLHESDAFLLTKLPSFTDLMVCMQEGQQLSMKYDEAFAQTFNYISKKTEESVSIDRILVLNERNEVVLSNFADELDTEFPENSPYWSCVNPNVASASIQLNKNNENIILISQPIRLYDKTSGYVFMELNFGIINSLMENYKFGDSGNLFFLSGNNNLIGKETNTLPISMEAIKDSEHMTGLLAEKSNDSTQTHTSEYKSVDNSRYMVYSYISSIDAIIATSVAMTEVNQTAITTAIPLIFLMIIIFILLFVYKYTISKKILHPLGLLNRSLYMLKKGDLRARYNYNEDDEFGNLSTVFNQTISNLQMTTQNLKEREARNNIILENITDVIWEYDIASRTIKLPENWSKLIGVEYAESSYLYSIETFAKFIHINYVEEFMNGLTECVNSKQTIDFECQIIKQNGEYFWSRFNGSCMFNIYNEPHKVFGCIFDISDMKTREDTLKESAKRDDMTKLLKKVEMERIVNLDLKQNNIGHSLMIIDLDGFKSINDTFGHLIGDEVIIFTANTLKLLCGYDCDICRFGGDEFIVYVKKIYTLEETTQLAECIINTLNTGYITSTNQLIKQGCSIGIARSPKHGTTYVELMTKADIAIYYAKKHDKNQFTIYDPEMK